ncbi:thymidylate kinase [Galendromus occidentalis]|uniref:Thymidylate kinase n=1 Tax=Galendromus occidentalis TaxID=34638 RepID=A0AAJ6QSM0_9ACAR|nr:thymidylate kinase [Galendromus occidentalis]
MATRGALIVLEGLDRTGKSTQARTLVKNLNSKGILAELQIFPDRTTQIGKVISEYLSHARDLDDRAIHLLFSANRWEKKNAMVSKLEKGISLVVDRYAFSGVAFSSAKPGLSQEWCRQPDVGLLKPDVVFFLTADPETLKQRGGYGEERYENVEFQKRVAAEYSELEDPSWIRVDATWSAERIAEHLLTTVENTMRALPEKMRELWVD